MSRWRDRTLRFDRRVPGDWTAWLLRGALALAAVGAWLVPRWDPFLRLSMASVSLAGLLGAFLIPACPSREPALLRRVEIGWSSVFLLHYLGHLFDWYTTVPPFDTGLHAFGGLVAGLSAYWLGLATDLLWDRPTALRAFWWSFSAALTLGAVFEVAEFASDMAFGVGTQQDPRQTPRVDTMIDIAAETGTGLVSGGLAAWWTRRRLRREPQGAGAARPART